MTLFEWGQRLTSGEMAGWAVMALVLLFSLIQISPLKLNPWDHVFAWIGKKVNEETEQRMKALDRHVREMWISDHRQRILTFARECRADISHSSDEWSHILTLAADYENYCEQNTVTNGVVRADTEYIRQLYQELCREHRI